MVPWNYGGTPDRETELKILVIVDTMRRDGQVPVHASPLGLSSWGRDFVVYGPRVRHVNLSFQVLSIYDRSF